MPIKKTGEQATIIARYTTYKKHLFSCSEYSNWYSFATYAIESTK
jgi:hypothetical protein